MSMNIAPRPRRRDAFTLVELLTVIAIIAILAAIIFPVFAEVRNATRRGACISNMQKMYQAVKQFELDNRRYPDYLFGPALDADGFPLQDASAPAGLSMEEIATILKATVTSSTPQAEAEFIRRVQREYKNSIFPEYINDLSVYRCPNNTLANTTADKTVAAVERLERQSLDNANVPFTPVGNGTARVTRVFYRYDSYDANPAVGADGKHVPGTFKSRYARLWFPLMTRGDIDSLTPEDQGFFRNQLIFSNPSNDTFVTMCTYHVDSSKVIETWLNGQAKVLDTRKLFAFGTNAGATGGVQNDWGFFKMTPTKN
jgi:prepilin-type N-terminal cleavage/methylation domain-containing protein